MILVELFLDLFKTCGYIFGPAIWAAGLFAIYLCIRASQRSSTPESRHKALKFSLLPLALGLLGAVFGFVMWRIYGEQANSAAVASALGRVCLAGLVVTAVPLLWSLSLRRSRPQVA